MPSHFKKRESWWGVALTAVVCGGFLWWWFQPPPLDEAAARDPRHWLGLARDAFGAADPPASASFEALVVALRFEHGGEPGMASAIADDWLPAAWRRGLTEVEVPRDARALSTAGVPDPALAEVATALRRAWEALDQLDVDRAAAVMLEARSAAEQLTGAARDHGLWLVAARQARSGFTADARESRARVASTSVASLLPAWLVIELCRAEMAAPVLEWCVAHPDDPAPVVAELLAVVRDRLAHREAGELSDHGPRADPTAVHPPADADLLSIHEAIESNQLRKAAELADRLPRGPGRAAAWLTIARTLAWNAEGRDG